MYISIMLKSGTKNILIFVKIYDLPKYVHFPKCDHWVTESVVIKTKFLSLYTAGKKNIKDL